MTFQEPHTLLKALNAFPLEYTEDIKEYVYELIAKKILIPLLNENLLNLNVNTGISSKKRSVNSDKQIALTIDGLPFTSARVPVI